MSMSTVFSYYTDLILHTLAIRGMRLQDSSVSWSVPLAFWNLDSVISNSVACGCCQQCIEWLIQWVVIGHACRYFDIYRIDQPMTDFLLGKMKVQHLSGNCELLWFEYRDMIQWSMYNVGEVVKWVNLHVCAKHGSPRVWGHVGSQEHWTLLGWLMPTTIWSWPGWVVRFLAKIWGAM